MKRKSLPVERQLVADLNLSDIQMNAIVGSTGHIVYNICLWPCLN